MKKQKKQLSIGAASSLLLAAFFSINTVFAEDLFSDLPVSHPNYNAILLLKDQGILSGYPDGTFKPEQPINRVESLKLIMEINKLNSSTTPGIAEFTDTEKGAWYNPYLNQAVYLEVISGYPDGTFKPAQTVNLVEFLKMSVNAGEYDLSAINLNQIPYSDAVPGQWYFKYLSFAKKYQILDEDNQNKVYPAKELTRASAAEIIYRLKNLDLKNPPKETPKPNDNQNEKPADLLDNMALFVSESYKFAIQYPKMWFYGTIANETEGAIRTYGFGTENLAEEGNKPKFILELLPLSTEFSANATVSGFEYQEAVLEESLELTVKLADAKRLYRLRGAKDDANLMLIVLKTITEKTEGLSSYNPAEKKEASPASSTPSTSSETEEPKEEPKQDKKEDKTEEPKSDLPPV